MLCVDFQPLGDHAFGQTFVVDQFGDGPRFDPSFWNQCAKRECIRFRFLAGPFANAVKIGGDARVRCVHQIMGEFVKHHKQFFILSQTAVDSDVMSAKYAIVESAYAQRHFVDGNLMPFAQPIKVVLC